MRKTKRFRLTVVKPKKLGNKNLTKALEQQKRNAWVLINLAKKFFFMVLKHYESHRVWKAGA